METLINEKTNTVGDLVENLSILSNWIYMKENYNCNTHVTSNDFLVEESFDFMSSVYDQDDFSVIIIGWKLFYYNNFRWVKMMDDINSNSDSSIEQDSDASKSEFHPRLPKTSTSSPPWIFESVVLVLIVIAGDLRFKPRMSGRKQGIWKSRTAKTSTSCGGLVSPCLSVVFSL